MFYFYCPKCGYQEEVKILPKDTEPNVRDGYGVPVCHYPCKECGNPDAGYMCEQTGDMDEKVYYRSIISLYQNIRESSR